MATKFYNGYCPECAMNGQITDMKLNKNDLWECPEDHLQIAALQVFAIILWQRGEGVFREPPVYASDTVSGDAVLVESASIWIEPTAELFNSDEDLRQYLSQKVEPVKTDDL